MRFSLLACAAVTILLASCSKQPEKAAPAPVEPPKPVIGAFGVDLTQMDTTVRPGDDFFKYVNGKWLATAEIPADRPFAGSIITVFDNTEAKLHAIIDELAASKSD